MDALTMQLPPVRQHAASPANVNESTNDPSSQNSATDTIMAPAFTNFESRIRQTMQYRNSPSLHRPTQVKRSNPCDKPGLPL